MPRLDAQFRILPVRHRLPTRSQESAESRLQQVLVDSLHWNAVDARAQRFFGNEVIRGMAGIDFNRLCESLTSQKRSKKNCRKQELFVFMGGSTLLKRLNSAVYWNFHSRARPVSPG